MGSRPKHVCAWVETGLYLAGFTLLCAFFAIRSEADQQREAGISEFRVAVAMPVDAAEAGLAGMPLGTAGTPDQTLWSEQRVRAYAQSRAMQADAPVGIISIGKLGIEVPVYDGADDLNLDRGVARIRGTARIGEPGNLGIAGHRDGFFRPLKDIAIGDRIELATPDGDVVYTVSAIEIVDPADVWVLAPTPSKTITLVTCYPFYFVGSAPKRFIVKAEAQLF